MYLPVMKKKRKKRKGGQQESEMALVVWIMKTEVSA